MNEMLVHAVVKERNKVLIYDRSNWENKAATYYVIGSADSGVKVGDVIEYEPHGLNYGYFVRVIGSKL